KNLSGALARAFCRAGLALGCPSLRMARANERELKPQEMLPVSDFKLGDKEKIGGREARRLTYKVVRDGERDEFTVWIDLLTHLPLKREHTTGRGKEKFRIV